MPGAGIIACVLLTYAYRQIVSYNLSWYRTTVWYTIYIKYASLFCTKDTHMLRMRIYWQTEIFATFFVVVAESQFSSYMMDSRAANGQWAWAAIENSDFKLENNLNAPILNWSDGILDFACSHCSKSEWRETLNGRISWMRQFVLHKYLQFNYCHEIHALSIFIQNHAITSPRNEAKFENNLPYARLKTQINSYLTSCPLW